ncbi:hypothetical protein DMN91_003154 [Ooceraea biroi]|uniref:Uncharacterized protein n=1 Tax=Ooceraea biroi TaxID=2015173 RepID=A0A3L8DXP3_OOCBI|nr:hypothetical protein DMN91_003154 [Ooceraea biroi]
MAGCGSGTPDGPELPQGLHDSLCSTGFGEPEVPELPQGLHDSLCSTGFGEPDVPEPMAACRRGGWPPGGGGGVAPEGGAAAWGDAWGGMGAGPRSTGPGPPLLRLGVPRCGGLAHRRRRRGPDDPEEGSLGSRGEGNSGG